jgi:hypothetical protein
MYTYTKTGVLFENKPSGNPGAAPPNAQTDLILDSDDLRQRDGRIVNVFEHLHTPLQLSRPR